MCGIAGVIGENAADRVRSMLPHIRHRGPDGEGIWTSRGSVALGHTRLAINDLSDAGSQPMCAAEGGLSVVVNGEIYNYPELRRELEAKGSVFRSASDSEIVVHAWRHWGTACFSRFNGMFAIGIFDETENTLVLARDRVGIKPVYYCVGQKDFVFSSEIKAVIPGLKGGDPGIDPVGLNQYLTYQNYFGGRTLSDQVKLLPPGTFLSYKTGGQAEINRFWALAFDNQDHGLGFEGAVASYRKELNASVSRHLMSDVPVASYLSAGFDSATVASRAAAHGVSPVCFTGTFEEGGWYDETSMAREMARHNGSDHIAVEITSSDLTRVMDRLIYSLDEPRMGMGSFPQYCVAEKVAETHKVILTGHGGDELFSGYPVFKLVNLIDSLKKTPAQAIRNLATLRFSEFPHLAYFVLSSFKAKRYRQYLPVLNSVHALKHGLKKEWSDAISDLEPEDELTALDGVCENEMQVLYSHYLQAYLNGLLIVEDKLSMAHSLESRTPMLDNSMLELSLSIPQQLKMHRGELKAIIKEGGREWLPDALYKQPKRGFPTPLRFWLRGPLQDWFRERLQGDASGLRIIFRDKWLKDTCSQYLNSPRQKIRPLDEIQSHRMWQLLSLESWLRQNCA